MGCEDGTVKTCWTVDLTLAIAGLTLNLSKRLLITIFGHLDILNIKETLSITADGVPVNTPSSTMLLIKSRLS